MFNLSISVINFVFNNISGIGGPPPASDVVLKSLARRVYHVQRLIIKESGD